MERRNGVCALISELFLFTYVAAILWSYGSHLERLGDDDHGGNCKQEAEEIAVEMKTFVLDCRRLIFNSQDHFQIVLKLSLGLKNICDNKATMQRQTLASFAT